MKIFQTVVESPKNFFENNLGKLKIILVGYD